MKTVTTKVIILKVVLLFITSQAYGFNFDTIPADTTEFPFDKL